MNTDILKGKWEQLKGNVQKEWGELTDDEVDQVKGDVTKLEGLIREHYGKSREEAHKDIDRWYDKYAA